MSRFATTRWSLIAASRGAGPHAEQALSKLLHDYRGAILGYVMRQGHAVDVAEDLTQGFLTQMLERDFNHRVDPAAGGFRAWLVTALRNYLLNTAAAERASKRGGGLVTQALDEAAELAASDADPQREFDRVWALEILRIALRNLRTEAYARGKQPLFDALSPFLVEPPDPDDYSRVAESLGLRRNTVAVAVGRLRLRLQALIRAAVSETVSGPDALEQELRELGSLLSK